MAPLAHTLALLALTVATAAVEELHLDMAQNSFDDQYLNCSLAMAKEMPALMHSELQQNPLFAEAWGMAVARWGPVPFGFVLPSRQAIALMFYTMGDLSEAFDAAVRVAGRSRQEYRDNFHWKTLHFLLTDALQRLRDIQGQHLYCATGGVRNVRFKAQPGDTVRFGQFMVMSPCDENGVPGMDTVFVVHTNHSTDVQLMAYNQQKRQLLIPPFETFNVTLVTQLEGVTHIYLNSTGTRSNHNCEWLRGGSISRDPPLLGGLLLATAALAVATGTL